MHHPAYRNEIFTVFADAVKMGDTITTDMKPVVRVNMQDYPTSRVDKLLPFPGGKIINIETLDDMASLNEYGKFGTLLGMCEAFFSGNFWSNHGPDSNIGKTTQEYIEENGNVIVIGLKEHDELL